MPAAKKPSAMRYEGAAWMRSASQMATPTENSCAHAIHVVIDEAVATDPRKHERDDVRQHAVQDVLADVAADVHAEMQAERADAQRRPQVLEQLR